ncbi:MAG: hypothetical protein LUD51_07265 [Clostridia bacterium]|nr:hypothetical protein [Clostridia bacterium]
MKKTVKRALTFLMILLCASACMAFAACTIQTADGDTQTASSGTLKTFSSEDKEITIICDFGEYSGYEVLFATVKNYGVTSNPDIATWITVTDEEHGTITLADAEIYEQIIVQTSGTEYTYIESAYDFGLVTWADLVSIREASIAAGYCYD